MAQNVTVEQVDIQTKKAQKNLQDLSKEMDQVAESSAEMNEELDESQEGINEAGEGAGKASKEFGGMPGPLGAAGGAVKGLSGAFKALLANPVVLVITLIVAGLTALVKAFTSTKEGGEKLKQLWAGLGAAMDVVRDIAVVLGKALVGVFRDPQASVKNLWQRIKENLIDRFQAVIDSARAVGKILRAVFEFDFATAKEGAKEFAQAMVQVATGFTPEEIVDGLKKVGNTFREIGQEIKNEAVLAARLTGELQKITDLQRELSVQRAEQNRELANQRVLIEDINATFDDRLKAIDQVLNAESKLLAQELDAQKRRLAAEEALAALSDSDAETLDKIAQLRIQIANTEAANASVRLRIEKRRAAILKERDALEATFAKKSADRHIAQIDDELTRELAKIEQLRALDEIALEQSKLSEIAKQEQLLEIEEYYAFLAEQKRAELAAKQKKADEKDAADKDKIEKALAENKIGYAESAAAAVTGIAKEGTKLYKGVSAAQALIDTYKAANAAYASFAGLGPVGVVLGIAAAAAAIVSGLRNVKKILSTDPSGGGAGQPSVPSGGGGFGSAIAETDLTAPAVRSVIDPNAPPPKSYVVSQEMSTQQELDARIESQAGL